MVYVNPTISIPTLQVSGLKYTNQKTRTVRVDKKSKTTTWYLQETHFKYENTDRLEVKG